MRLLLRGGPVHAPSAPGADALLAVDGTVAWIGPSAGADMHAEAADVVVNLAGALVAPAFVDAHVHHTMTGLTLLGLDLAGVPSREQLLERVSAEARRSPAQPLVGHGWDETIWPDPALPTSAELDRAGAGAAVYLSRADVHSALVSSALLASVGPLEGVPGYQPGGRVTGRAHERVRRHLTERMPGGLREAAQRATRRHAARRGIVALHEAAGPAISGADDLRALQALAGREPGPALVSYWGAAGGPDQALALGAQGAAGDLFVDGALGSRTAWLTEPYSDAPETRGSTYLDPDEVAEHLVACTEAGVQAGFHAIGDAAVDTVVAGLQVAMRRCGVAAVRAARHRVEHLSMARDDHAEVLAAAGVLASVQPSFDARWGGAEGAYRTRLGPRAEQLHDFAALVRAGVSLAFGSDSPVTPMEPWEWVRAAVWHHAPSARLSARAAFAAATRGGWRAARRDDAGLLAPGAPATFAVWAADDLVVQAPDPRVASWSTDPRSGTPGLPRLEPSGPAPRCLATVLDGQALHVAEDAPTGMAALGSGSVAP
jgi:hypothetical protein